MATTSHKEPLLGKTGESELKIGQAILLIIYN